MNARNRKMSDSDYGLLKMRVIAVLTNGGGIDKTYDMVLRHHEKNEKIKNAHKATRWHIFWAAGGTEGLDGFLLHDSHIDTALRHIMKEIRND